MAASENHTGLQGLWQKNFGKNGRSLSILKTLPIPDSQNLIIFLQYPEAIRKIIYTTNSIESLNSQLRKVTKNKRVFPSDESVFKTLYLTINYITAKWTMPIRNWNEAMAHFLIKFEDRIQNNI